MSLGLALSGGGSKAAVHIGVLKAFEEENIKIDYISGASSGSIISTLYACGYSPLDMIHLFNSYCKYIGDFDRLIPFKAVSTMFTGKINVCGLAKGDKLENLIYNICKNKGIIDISQIKYPLAIPTVDLSTGEVIYFLNKSINDEYMVSKDIYDDIPVYKYNGKIASIVRASSSFPGVFEPKIIDKRILVDGGIRDNTPINILKKMGADKVVAVSFDNNTKGYCSNLNIVSVALKSFNIMAHNLNKLNLKYADYVISPSIPSNISLLDCSKTKYLVNIGYNKAKSVINQIKNDLKI